MEEMMRYNLWVKQQLEDKDLSDELAAIKGDTQAISDRFYRDLEFGTGGLRGVIGAGTNRMNIYTVRKATQGLADFLLSEYKAPSVAISYDSRIKSDLFAKECARVLSGNGIKVYIYNRLMPTPCLSYAVRELKCNAGIMITASHNPAKYNGYKCYGEDGCQMTIESADKVLGFISKVDIFNGIKLDDFERAVEDGNIEYISRDVEENYLANVKNQGINLDLVKDANLKVVYTPLNGTGNIPVRTILDRIGLTDVVVVKEQENPDGTFKTCPFPNPEIPEALQLGLDLAKKEKADLLLATDPDCDRVGIAVPDKNGEYVLLSGNEVGAMLLHYICDQRTKNNTMPKNPIAVETIVSTRLAEKIANHYNVETINVLTGFKFIGEQITFLEKKGEENRYIFGFEESYGYLA
ncbi:MAG: phospho-sugar mutase, partial [Oscillospiraceae bacterium]